MTFELLDIYNKLRTRPLDPHMGSLFPWMGSKQALLPYINERIPYECTEYIEPFAGGGSVLFSIQPDNFVLADNNEDLILLYRAVRDFPNETLEEYHKCPRSKERFNLVKEELNSHRESLSLHETAGKLLYILRHSYGGMYRVNPKGEITSQYGIHNATIDRKRYFSVSKYLKGGKIVHADMEQSIKSHAGRNSFVYMDPPYLPVSDTQKFTGYTKGGFSIEDHRRLRKCLDWLDSIGARFLLSNSNVPASRELYKGYRIEPVECRRCLPKAGKGIYMAKELLVSNY